MADFSDAEMVEFFQAHPALRARFVSLARAIENSEGGLEEADAAQELLVEELLVEEMRLLGTGGAAGLGRGARGGDFLGGFISEGCTRAIAAQDRRGFETTGPLHLIPAGLLDWAAAPT